MALDSLANSLRGPTPKPKKGQTMIRRWPLTVLAGATALPLVALALAAHGVGGAAAAAARPATQASTASVATLHAAGSRLGTILVDSHGHTLYLFKADKGKEHLLGCLCSCVAAAAGTRQADRGHWDASIAYRNHPPV